MHVIGLSLTVYCIDLFVMLLITVLTHHALMREANVARFKSAVGRPSPLSHITKSILCTSVNKCLNPLCKLTATDFCVSFNDKLVNVKRLLSLSLTKLGLNHAPSFI